MELSVEGERDMAVATLVGHSAYLRPEELFSLRCQDVLEPASTTGVYCHWTLLLGPLETRKPTKTGVFDDCVILDHPSLQWLGSHLRRLKNGREPHEIIWPFARDRYAQRFKAVAKKAGMEKWNLVPYSLRHSGPSWDRATRHRTLQEVQRRGRWMTEKCVC